MSDFDELTQAIDEESYQWMEDNQPRLLNAIKASVARGKSPDEIYRYVLRQTERPPISQRARQVARYLAERVK